MSIRFPFICVKWLDHNGEAGWESVPDIQKTKPSRAVTYGWLIHEDKDTIKVANTILDCGTIGGRDLILKSCIEEWYEVTLP